VLKASIYIHRRNAESDRSLRARDSSNVFALLRSYLRIMGTAALAFPHCGHQLSLYYFIPPDIQSVLWLLQWNYLDCLHHAGGGAAFRVGLEYSQKDAERKLSNTALFLGTDAGTIHLSTACLGGRFGYESSRSRMGAWLTEISPSSPLSTGKAEGEEQCRGLLTGSAHALGSER
jgi:hypothetical protein